MYEVAIDLDWILQTDTNYSYNAIRVEGLFPFGERIRIKFLLHSTSSVIADLSLF